MKSPMLWITVLVTLINAPAYAVQVMLQNFPAGPSSLIDPAHATLPNTTFSTLPNKGDADLAAGTFRSYSDGTLTTGTASSMVAELQALTFTNTSGSSISLATGALSAHVSGSYLFTPVVNGSASAQVNALLHVVLSAGPTFDAAASSQSIEVWDAQGNLLGAPYTRFTSGVTEGGGGHTVITHAGLDGLTADLLMPAIVLGPGQVMQVSFTLDPAAPGKTAIADFYTSGASLSLLLPPGVTLHSDASVPLGWVTAVPEPESVWLLGVGALVLAARLRRRRPAS
jgi:hypothetical protein